MLYTLRNTMFSDTLTVAAQAATYTGAGGAVAAHALSLPEWAAIVSMSVAVLGFLIQFALAIRIFYRDATHHPVEDDEPRPHVGA